MKKFKKLSLISLALVGGGVLATIPFITTSCGDNGNDSGSKSDKYINWNNPNTFHMGPTIDEQHTGMELGTMKLNSDFCLGSVRVTPTPINMPNIWISNYTFGGDGTKVRLFVEGTDPLPIGKYLAHCELYVGSSAGSPDIYEQLVLMLPIEVTA